MSTFNPYDPPLASAESSPPAQPIDLTAPQGLGGWLILVAFGVLVSPFMALRQIRLTYTSVFQSGAWSNVTTLGNPEYHALWAPLIVFESVGQIGLLLAWSYMVYLFFGKKAAFPVWYSWVQVISLAFMIVDTVMLQIVRPDLPMIDPESGKEFARAIVAVAIWVPYMRYSQRVKATFRRR